MPLNKSYIYLKKLYYYSDTMGNIKRTLIEEDTFSLEGIEFEIKNPTNNKDGDIEGYQTKIIKIGRSVLIMQIHNLLNFAVTHGIPKLWMQRLIVPIFKSGDKNVPSNYRTIMISHILVKLYGMILEKNISTWLEIHGKRDKGKICFIRNHSTIDYLVTLRTIVKDCHNSKVDLLYYFVDSRKDFDTTPQVR